MKIQELSPHIEVILKLEVARGNKVVEENIGWPDEKSVIIILEQPFERKYEIEELKYRFINDPHYWKEEYSDSKFKQTIACRF